MEPLETRNCGCLSFRLPFPFGNILMYFRTLYFFKEPVVLLTLQRCDRCYAAELRNKKYISIFPYITVIHISKFT